jgi:FtsH-binding integral membrane protein
MDLPRKIGIAIVMIIPAFVGAGALWHLLSSWFPILLWIGLIAAAYAYVLHRFRS